MKRILSLILALVIFVGCCSMFVSCGAPENAGPEISVYLGSDVYDFDPSDYYVNSNAEQLMSLLFEPLFSVNKRGKLKMAAASDYTVNEEERTIVIELRETYWSDDVQVKAQDYIYAWVKRILDPNKANPAASLFYDIENAVAVKSGDLSVDALGAVASGPYEITITYREGADYKRLLKNLASVATSPIREDVVNTASAYWTKAPSSIVTNGPFKVEEYDLNTYSFTLARNLGYHQRSSVTAYADKVIPSKLISFISPYGEELSVSYADIEDKTVFYMLDASLEDTLTYKNKAEKHDDLSTYTYVFNTDNALFAIPEVRRALSLALDRNAIASAIGIGKAATSFVSAPIADELYGKGTRPLSSESDLSEAEILLEAVSKTLSKHKLEFTLTVNNDEKSLAIAEIAVEAWAELGFDVTIEAVDTIKTTVYDDATSQNIDIYDSAIQYLVKNASYGKRDFDVIALDWQMYSTDAFVSLSAFSTSMSGLGTDFSTNKLRVNISGWTDSEYDAYINAAYMAETEDEREEALKNAESILLESSPVIPVIFNQNFALSSDDISGVTYDGFGNFVLTDMTLRDYELYLEDNFEDEEEEYEEEEEEEEEEE